jgi:hypothetical protein
MNTPVSVPSGPWYREFWPWFIIAMLSGAVIGSLTSAWFAIRTQDAVLDHGDQAQ